MANLLQQFIQTAGQRPGHTALVHNSTHISYAYLLQLVEQTTATYTGKEIKEGDRVLVIVPVNHDWYRIVPALLSIGAHPVVAGAGVSIDELKQHGADCDCIIADSKTLLLSGFNSVLRQIPIKIKTGYINEDVTQTELLPPACLALTVVEKDGIKYLDYNSLSACCQSLLQELTTGSEISLVVHPLLALIQVCMGKTTVLPPAGYNMRNRELTGMLVDEIITAKADEIVCTKQVALSIADLAGTYDDFKEQLKHVLLTDSISETEMEEIRKAFPKAKIGAFNKAF